MGKNEKHQEAIDRGDYGKPVDYESSFAGPKCKRSCTDIVCLLLFVAFIVAWAIVGYIAFSNGDPSKLNAPIDSDGSRCGVDPGVTDKPYLFYFDVGDCFVNETDCFSVQVCVEKCPKEFYFYEKELNESYISAKDKAICRKGYTGLDNLKDKDDIEKELKEAWKYKQCAKWYMPTESVSKRCLRWAFDLSNETLINNITSSLPIDNSTMIEAMEVAKVITQLKEIGETIVSDLAKTWPFLLAAIAISMLVCLIYIILMRWFAGLIVWISLFGVIAILAYCCYASYVKYDETKNAEYNFDVSIDSILALKATWMFFLILSSITLIVVLVMIIFLRKRIHLAIALIAEASRAIGSVTSTLPFPIIPWLLQIGVVAWAVAVGMYIVSATNPVFEIQGVNSTCTCDTYENGAACDPSDFEKKCSNLSITCGSVVCQFVKHEQEAYTGYLQGINIFGFFWGLFFISAFGEMALAGTFATWYWTFNKSDIPFFTLMYSVGRTMRYHLGTLAFGSLIITICRVIRVILEYINNQLRKYDNVCAKIFMCCCRCFFWCLEKFIKFINRNAYIMCSIHGKNFCLSARDAFNLLMRNIVRVLVVDKVTDFLLLLGKLLVTGGMVALAFYFFSDDLNTDDIVDVPEVNYYLIPVFIVGISTYFIASIFFGVYAMAVDTLFLCFLEDLERNDGSPERPYYMSKRLMKILGKKNTKYKEA